MKKRLVTVLLAVSLALEAWTPAFAADWDESEPIAVEECDDTLTEIEEESVEAELDEEEWLANHGGVVPTGLIVRESEPISEESLKGVEIIDADSDEFEYDLTADTELLGSASYENSWQKYTSYYVYNHLTSDEQKYWNALDAMCAKMMTSTKNYFIHTDAVSSSKLSLTEVYNVAWLFMYSCPQYHFIRRDYKPACGWTTDSGRALVQFRIYTSCNSGATRKKHTEEVMSTVNLWAADVNRFTTEYDKVTRIQELICDKVYYYVGNLEEIPEETVYSQGCYSVFRTDQTHPATVCAGYSQAFAMMCSAVGIEAMSVTGNKHEWNRVAVDDSWYIMDLTWIDGNVPDYTYFLRSYNALQAMNSRTAACHVEEPLWKGLLPPCTRDTGSTSTTRGRIPATTVTCAAPWISFTPNAGGYYWVTMGSATPGATIYYYLGAVNPSQGASRATVYRGGFKLDSNVDVRAIAVLDGAYDSPVTVMRPAVPIYKYKITYKLNKGKNSKKNPTTFTSLSSSVALKDATRKNMVFDGWYTDKKFKNRITKISGSIGKNITLYAKWHSKTKYTIVFNANKGKGKTKSMKCVYGKAYKLSAKKCSRKGYTFAGWNTKKNGKGKMYSNRQKIKNLTGKKNGKVTLYAQWRKNKK